MAKAVKVHFFDTSWLQRTGIMIFRAFNKVG